MKDLFYNSSYSFNCDKCNQEIKISVNDFNWPWISVKDELPPLNGRVLINHILLGTISGYLEEKNKWIIDSFMEIENEDITHWSIIPKPPII